MFPELNMENAASLIGQVATVALIVVATRWLIGAKGAQLPRTRDGTNVYGIKWQMRTFGLALGVFSALLSTWAWHDRRSVDLVILVIPLVFLVIGIWLASGLVTTDQNGITKKVLWRSRSIRWGDITEVRLHKRDGGAIELRAGSRKLIIDSRFVAPQHLLNEIADHTQLQPTQAS
jgi:hypothetical protein